MTSNRAAEPRETERREDGWDELRREIEALHGYQAVVNMDDPREWWIDAVKRDEVLAIVDRLAAARGEPESDEPGLDVKRRRWAEWISEAADTWPIVAQGDWACAECRPTSDIVEPGWRCVIHEARAALVQSSSSEPENDR